jgi:hypothetical protein
MLPAHLRTLAHVDAEVTLEVVTPATIASTLDALESRYPVLCCTIRDHDTLQRRQFIRYFACQEDLSHQDPNAPLPDAVLTASEPLIVLGAIAGG